MTKFILLILLTVSNAFAEDTVIKPGDSVEFHNAMQVHEFLLNANQLQAAAYLSATIENNRYNWMTRKSFWGDDRTEEGFTYYVKKDIYVREDIMSRSRRLNFMDPQSPSGDFSTGMTYVNVVIHEMYHLHDYMSSPLSSENETYYRSFVAYRDILQNYLLNNYQTHSEIGSPEAVQWAERVKSYAQSINTEMSTYEPEKYGEIVQTFPPLWQHAGCVKPQLTRQEFANYSLKLGGIFNPALSFIENWKEFDRWARFMYPTPGTKNCVDKEPAIVPLVPSLPVGYSGPRLRQRIFEIPQVPKDNYLHIKKLSEMTEKANVTITVAVHDPTSEPHVIPKVILKKGYIYSWYKEGEVLIDSDTQHVLVIVSENTENAFPQSLEYRFTRRWQNENGQWQEGFVGHRELASHEQARYGYRPVVENIQNIEFTKQSPRSHLTFTGQVTGFKINLDKGDYLRIAAPQVQNRSAVLYRFPQMEALGTMHTWHDGIDYSIEQTGTYYLIVTRHDQLETNRSFEMSLQFSRTGFSGPADIIPVALTYDDFAALGSHVPAQRMFEVTTDPETSALGVAVSWGTYRPFTLVDLDVKKGDWLNFRRLPSITHRSTAYIVKETNGVLTIVNTFYSWYQAGEFTVATDEKHYLAISQDEEFGPIRTSTVEVDHYRHSKAGPSEATYRTLAPQELERFGYFPMGRYQFAKASLTSLHPKGFVYTNHRFQHYRFQVRAKTRIVLNKGFGSAGEQRFILSAIDQALWNAGQPALRDLIRTYPWNNKNVIDIEPGDYILTVEGDLPKDANGTAVAGIYPWEMAMTSVGVDPRSVQIQQLTVGQMNDPRLKLIKP